MSRLAPAVSALILGLLSGAGCSAGNETPAVTPSKTPESPLATTGLSLVPTAMYKSAPPPGAISSRRLYTTDDLTAPYQTTTYAFDGGVLRRMDYAGNLTTSFTFDLPAKIVYDDPDGDRDAPGVYRRFVHMNFYPRFSPSGELTQIDSDDGAITFAPMLYSPDWSHSKGTLSTSGETVLTYEVTGLHDLRVSRVDPHDFPWTATYHTDDAGRLQSIVTHQDLEIGDGDEPRCLTERNATVTYDYGQKPTDHGCEPSAVAAVIASGSFDTKEACGLGGSTPIRYVYCFSAGASDYDPLDPTDIRAVVTNLIGVPLLADTGNPLGGRAGGGSDN